MCGLESEEGLQSRRVEFIQMVRVMGGGGGAQGGSERPGPRRHLPTGSIQRGADEKPGNCTQRFGDRSEHSAVTDKKARTPRTTGLP